MTEADERFGVGLRETEQTQLGEVVVGPALMIRTATATPASVPVAEDRSQPTPHITVQRWKRRPVTVLVALDQRQHAAIRDALLDARLRSQFGVFFRPAPGLVHWIFLCIGGQFRLDRRRQIDAGDICEFERVDHNVSDFLLDLPPSHGIPATILRGGSNPSRGNVPSVPPPPQPAPC